MTTLRIDPQQLRALAGSVNAQLNGPGQEALAQLRALQSALRGAWSAQAQTALDGAFGNWLAGFDRRSQDLVKAAAYLRAVSERYEALERQLVVGQPADLVGQAATGGAGKVYRYTSNPDVATGDGIAMAWRVGVPIVNMEFYQFHPTCLYHPEAKNFLVTEACRGEGGILRRADGTAFMANYHPQKDLAPRDIVARAIDFEMKKRGLDCVYLDISHKSADFLGEHFPNILARCLDLGIDITRQAIPVVPAAHYTCGGVVTDLRARTDIPGLYVAGEASCTGLHGANRLASNSLLECLVFAEAAANDILEQPARDCPALPLWDASRVSDPDEEIVISHNWDELRRFMWDYVGIVRTTKRLKRAQNRIRLLKWEIEEFYANFRVSHDLIELRNLVVTADLIIRCAMRRKESRGLHYTLDYPRLLPEARDTVLVP